jgi:hypothetical protein
MIDTESVVRAWLASIAGVTAKFGTRVYAGRYLPAGYLPSQGPGLLFAVRGGGQDYSSKVLNPSMQFRIYAETEGEARKAAQALYDAINDQQARQVCYARMEAGTMPTLLSEPGTDWPYILMYFKFQIQNP